MQPRRIARELALLSIGQLSTSTQLSESQEIESAMTAAIRTLAEEVRETLESASADLNRSSDRILESEIKATDIASARAMLNDAIEMTQTAINRLGTSIDLPEFIQISQSPEVREFAYSLIRACRTRRSELDEILTQALVDWQLPRLAKIDRNILRLAVAEICMLGIPDRVAINEAVELGKRYSSEEGHRFINGVLRRVTQNRNNPKNTAPLDSPGIQDGDTPARQDPVVTDDAPDRLASAAQAETSSIRSVPAIQVSSVASVSEQNEPRSESKRRVIPSPAERRRAASKPKLVKKEKKRVIDLTKIQFEQKQAIDEPEAQADERQAAPQETATTPPSDSSPSDSFPSSTPEGA